MSVTCFFSSIWNISSVRELQPWSYWMFAEHITGAIAGISLEDSSSSAAKHKPKKKRCDSCRKRVGLTGIVHDNIYCVAVLLILDVCFARCSCRSVFSLFGYHWQWKRRWLGHVPTNKVDCKKPWKKWRRTKHTAEERHCILGLDWYRYRVSADTRQYWWVSVSADTYLSISADTSSPVVHLSVSTVNTVARTPIVSSLYRIFHIFRAYTPHTYITCTHLYPAQNCIFSTKNLYSPVSVSKSVSV